MYVCDWGEDKNVPVETAEFNHRGTRSTKTRRIYCVSRRRVAPGSVIQQPTVSEEADFYLDGCWLRSAETFVVRIVGNPDQAII